MGSISYYEAIKGNPNAFSLRVKLVDHALRYSKKSAAKFFSCKDHSRRPQPLSQENSKNLTKIFRLDISIFHGKIFIWKYQENQK